jgi:hypothetical protein
MKELGGCERQNSRSAQEQASVREGENIRGRVLVNRAIQPFMSAPNNIMTHLRRGSNCNCTSSCTREAWFVDVSVCERQFPLHTHTHTHRAHSTRDPEIHCDGISFYRTRKAPELHGQRCKFCRRRTLRKMASGCAYPVRE